MPLTVHNTSNLEEGSDKVIAAASLAYDGATPNLGLVSMGNVPQGSTNYTVITFGRLTMSGTEEDQDQTFAAATADTRLQALTASHFDQTPTMKAILVGISHLAQLRTQAANLEMVVGTLMSNALSIREDVSITSLFPSFTALVGAMSEQLTLASVQAVISHLQGDTGTAYGVPMDMPKGSLHPYQINDLMTSFVGTAAARPAGRGDEFTRRWLTAEDPIYGCGFYRSPHMVIDANDDTHGAIFTEEALMHVQQEEARFGDDYQLARDVTIYVLRKLWIDAIWKNPFGVEVFTRADDPIAL